jgi:predicted double-glycine peptidase
LTLPLCLVAAPCAVKAADSDPVRSILELRRDGVVIQQWDLSCGAAALATILNYQHGDQLSEREIALGLMSRREYLLSPQLVAQREGFSLLDLKRFVDARGYRGTGLGQLGSESALARAPLIVPIDTHGYNHFVALVGAMGRQVLLADPAFGYRTMGVSDFEEAWTTFETVGRIGFIVERTDGLIPPNRLLAHRDRFLTLRP